MSQRIVGVAQILLLLIVCNTSGIFINIWHNLMDINI